MPWSAMSQTSSFCFLDAATANLFLVRLGVKRITEGQNVKALTRGLPPQRPARPEVPAGASILGGWAEPRARQTGLDISGSIATVASHGIRTNGIAFSSELQSVICRAKGIRAISPADNSLIYAFRRIPSLSVT